MIRWVTLHRRELNDAGPLKGEAAPIENPVDAGAPLAALETVKCSGIGGRQNIAERKGDLFRRGWRTGKRRVAGGVRRAVEISTQDDRPIDGPGLDVRPDDLRAGDLNGFAKVQMGCRADYLMSTATERPYCALPRPAALRKAAGDRRGGAEEKMLPPIESPRRPEADDVVLPEGRCRVTSADDVMARQAFGDEVNLKIVDFLKHHDVAGMPRQEIPYYRSAVRPVLGAVVGQAEAQIQCHDGKSGWPAGHHDGDSVSNWRINPVRSACTV
jgi:hypothetical protein